MQGWDPWAEADRRGLYPELVDLPHDCQAVRFQDWRGTMILLDRDLEGPERAAALAHELVHDERGGCIGHGPATWRPLRAREEHQVEAEVARRLVPVKLLARFCDRMADLGEGVGPDEVMGEFDVPRRVAEAALDNLTEHERGTR